MENIEVLAERALKAGAVDVAACRSKQEVLDKIRADEADTMAVSRPLEGIVEDPQLAHTAVRFHDRELGEKVRRYTMQGFNLV